MNVVGGACALALLFLASAANADVITEWNTAALQVIRSRATSPPVASRNLAMLHAAMYDAVYGIRRSHERYLALGTAPGTASLDAAATTAARDVLASLYPADVASFDELHARILQRIVDGPRKEKGIAWGATVAAQMIALRANDGSATTAPFPESDKPGEWRPTPSFGGVVRPALLPHWGKVAYFALKRGRHFRPPAPPPPTLRSLRYAQELNQVQRIGGSNSTLRTVEQTQIAQFWGYGPGSATPPGHWNQIAQSVAMDQGNTMPENARLFALLNLAMADAAILSWDIKYRYNFWRPITAIQLAEIDGNVFTAADPVWAPLLETPPFPEYTSGHSTFSGAAAAVLSMFYGNDRIAFSVGSDDLPGIVRFYDGFADAAWESGLSRIYGGIHFMSANLHGLRTGAETGEYVARHFLRRSADGRK